MNIGKRLEGKVALITGGASGLGQATVEAYVAKGVKAVILDINEDKASQIIDNLGEDKVMFISTDIMKEDPVVEAINKIKDNNNFHPGINTQLPTGIKIFKFEFK